jgi:hypothetical protein
MQKPSRARGQLLYFCPLNLQDFCRSKKWPCFSDFRPGAEQVEAMECKMACCGGKTTISFSKVVCRVSFGWLAVLARKFTPTAAQSIRNLIHNRIPLLAPGLRPRTEQKCEFTPFRRS